MSREQVLEERVNHLNKELQGALSLMQRQSLRISELEKQTAEQAEEIRMLRDELEQYRRLDTRPVVRLRKLTAAQAKTLREAIIESFDQGELEILLNDMDHNLAVLAAGGTYEEIVRDVVAAANREGWMLDLLGKIAERRPRRSDMQQLVGALKGAMGC